jgi:integrase
MRTKIKIEYWYKRIPNQYQEQLGGLGKFKISLSRIKKRTAKEKEIVKSMLNLKVSNIFNNIRDYDLEKAKEYLKTIINLMILELDNVEEISEQKINDKINVLTISKLMEGEKVNREKEYKINNITKKADGVDIDLKNDKTLEAYNSIEKYLYNFFKKDFDIKKINADMTQDFRYYLLDEEVGLGSINTYIKHLKAIFNRKLKKNLITFNPFSHLKDFPTSKNKQIFSLDEINNIKENLEGENRLIFETLLYSGMRLDELSSIKKFNIMNDCFFFKDSKNYFDKVVPIHPNILDRINKKLEQITDDNEYLFYSNINNNKKKEKDNKINSRVANIRLKLQDTIKENSNNKTVHKTRSTFVSYVNFYNGNFNPDDIRSLTHALSGEDNESYVIVRNPKNHKAIIDNIDFNKINEVVESLKTTKEKSI